VGSSQEQSPDSYMGRPGAARPGTAKRKALLRQEPDLVETADKNLGERPFATAAPSSEAEHVKRTRAVRPGRPRARVATTRKGG
jgi:hypothetical protein